MKLREKTTTKKLEQFIWQVSVQFDLTYAALLLAFHLLWLPSLDYFSFFCLKSFDIWVVALCKTKKGNFKIFFGRNKRNFKRSQRLIFIDLTTRAKDKWKVDFHNWSFCFTAGFYLNKKETNSTYLSHSPKVNISLYL